MEYTNENRGSIQLRDRARQIIDFKGLRYGNITPTDIDGVIEYHDKSIMLIEMKYKDAKLPKGQKIALTRMVDNIEKANKDACLFICYHNIDNTEIDIDAAGTDVRFIYWKRHWYQCNKKLDKVIEQHIRYVDNMPPGYYR